MRVRERGNEAEPLRAYVYPPAWRALAATLVAVSRASLPALLVLVLAGTDPPMTTPVLVRLFAALAAGPAVAAWLVGRVRMVELLVSGDELVLQRPALRLEIPCEAIARVGAWSMPLPGPGVSLRMRSGRRPRQGLQLPDPLPLLVALGDAGVDGARGAARHPCVAWAHARAAVPPWRWYHYLWKFVLFALLPTAVLFNAHQHIAFGGLFGEYYLLGRTAWLETFAVYWTTVAIYLVLYASLWRGVAEVVSLLAAAIAPSRAASVRSAAETACRWLYYGGVPVLLLLRFLP